MMLDQSNLQASLLDFSYDISKTIAFSRQNVLVEQTQLRASYCRRGLVYGVDTVTQNSGVVYSDYFVLNIHYRCQVRGLLLFGQFLVQIKL